MYMYIYFLLRKRQVGRERERYVCGFAQDVTPRTVTLNDVTKLQMSSASRRCLVKAATSTLYPIGR